MEKSAELEVFSPKHRKIFNLELAPIIHGHAGRTKAIQWAHLAAHNSICGSMDYMFLERPSDGIIQTHTDVS